MIPAIWDIGKFTWDTALPSFIISSVKTFDIFGTENVHINGRAAIFLIRGANSSKRLKELNECAARFSQVVFFIYGDEEGMFDCTLLEHPNKKIWWAMPPFHRQHPDRLVVNGWPSDAGSIILQESSHTRTLDWSFFGQVTNRRRRECVDALQMLQNGNLLETHGFKMGPPFSVYYNAMCRSKMIPCPSGPLTVDSFRFAEALECGAIPIADNICTNQEFPAGYWNTVFRDERLPFPIIDDWSTLPDVMAHWLTNWENRSLICQRWWKDTKQKWRDQLCTDVSYGL